MEQAGRQKTDAAKAVLAKINARIKLNAANAANLNDRLCELERLVKGELDGYGGLQAHIELLSSHILELHKIAPDVFKPVKRRAKK